MAVEKHEVIDLAENQLRSAIGLFVSEQDLFSAITLAGAADTLLCRLVSNQGEENFTQHVLESENDPNKTIAEMGREINDMFFINALKHMDANDDGIVVMDVKEAAIGAILKALPNYITLRGNNVDFVQAFLAWVKLNLDPAIYNIDCDPKWEPTKA
ncbi:MAG: hypothetical protein JKY34_03000 [Kordiimonadaceae bacterium]|nr:hypothetical protein [Kordiimonadaceae bacterium]